MCDRALRNSDVSWIQLAIQPTDITCWLRFLCNQNKVHPPRPLRNLLEFSVTAIITNTPALPGMWHRPRANTPTTVQDDFPPKPGKGTWRPRYLLNTLVTCVPQEIKYGLARTQCSVNNVMSYGVGGGNTHVKQLIHRQKIQHALFVLNEARKRKYKRDPSIYVVCKECISLSITPLCQLQARNATDWRIAMDYPGRLGNEEELQANMWKYFFFFAFRLANIIHWNTRMHESGYSMGEIY